MSQFGGKPLADELETKYKSNMDLISEVSEMQEPKIIKLENRRKFKNATEDIGNFFQNLTKTKHNRAKSNDATKNIPFQLLMSNFRRKKILETL